MKKKGFTLIELLAVIVILAVIALIATPIVLNLIEKARKGAAESDAYAYVNAVETSLVSYLMAHNDADVSGIYTTQDDGSLKGTSELTINIKNNSKLNGLLVVSELKPELKGNKPASGAEITIGKKGSVENVKNMEIGGYKVSYDVSSKKFKASSKSDSSIGEEEKPETPKKCTASNECACTGTCTLEELKTGISFSYDPGDGINHIFYLLNNSSSKIIAIMDRNITEGAKDESGNANAVIYQAEAKTLAESLKWNNVETVRLPKANEIAYIGCTDSSWNSATATTSNAFYFGTNNLSDTSKRNQYKWLYNYTRDCVNSDCDKSLNTPEASGYWTSDIVYGKTTHAWVVNDRGFLDYGNTTYANKPVGGGYGVRPVVEVSPSNLYQ